MPHERAEAALAILAALVLDTGEVWGEIATDWQWADAEAVLDPESAQRWHWLGRPKGGSKSTDAAGFALAWLVEQAPAAVDGYVLAADEDQAKRIISKAKGFVTRTPALSGLVTVDTLRIVGPNGAAVTALAADDAGNQGLLPHFVVVDELANWKTTAAPRAVWESIISDSGKMDRPPNLGRLVVLTHAGDPASYWFQQLEIAKAEPGAWRVHEVPGPLSWRAEDGLRVQRRMLTESQYLRRHLNVWSAAEDRLVAEDDLMACATLDGPQPAVAGRSYVASLDMAFVKDRAVAAVMHAERRTDDDGKPVETRIVVDRLQVWKGSKARPIQQEDVEEWLVQAAASFRLRRLVCDPWQTKGMSQRLTRRGLAVREWTFSQANNGRLAVTLHQLLRGRRLAIPRDDDLLDELRTVRLKETSPNVLRIDHDSDKHDDQAVTIALGAVDLLEGNESSTFDDFMRAVVAAGPERSAPPANMELMVNARASFEAGLNIPRLGGGSAGWWGR